MMSSSSNIGTTVPLYFASINIFTARECNAWVNFRTHLSLFPESFIIISFLSLYEHSFWINRERFDRKQHRVGFYAILLPESIWI